jgi:hypothetical protein
VFSRGSDKSKGHVAFLKSKGLIWDDALGGNQGDEVCYSKYAHYKVVSYRGF